MYNITQLREVPDNELHTLTKEELLFLLKDTRYRATMIAGLVREMELYIMEIARTAHEWDHDMGFYPPYPKEYEHAEHVLQKIKSWAQHVKDSIITAKTLLK